MDYYSEQNQLNLRKSGNYDKVMASLTKCPFCDLKHKYIIKRVAGIYLTANLFPYIDGHLLIIPQRHIESASKLSKKEWKAVRELLLLSEKLFKKHLSIKNHAVMWQQGNGSGRSLKHFHISIIPNPTEVIKKEYKEITLSPGELAKMMSHS